MTTQAFPALSEAQKYFKTLVWAPGIKLGETWLETNVPFFAAPVVKQLTENFVGWVTDDLYSWLCTWVDMGAIRFTRAERQAAYERACLQIKILEVEKGLHSPEYQQGVADEVAAFQRFIRFIGN